jgi:histidine ammonia-lyase
MITSLGCEALERASAIARQADIVAALTLEVLKGTTKAFDTGQQVLSLVTHSTWASRLAFLGTEVEGVGSIEEREDPELPPAHLSTVSVW